MKRSLSDPNVYARSFTRDFARGTRKLFVVHAGASPIVSYYRVAGETTDYEFVDGGAAD